MRFIATAKRSAVLWLSQGISPQRLALTLALGFAVGCIPVVGIPTVLCAGLALALKLNFPAIQAANYAAMPLQLALIVPFVKLGGHMTAWLPTFNSTGITLPAALGHFSVLHFATRMSGMAGQALLAWLVAAVPAVLLMTLCFTLMLRRIPVCRSAATGD